LIKIFSVDDFHAWLTGDTFDLVRDALMAVRDAGMAMEVSSAGLRKPCAEIYPCPAIMRLAADLRVPIAFASDAHASDQIAYAFPELAAYAASFGYGDSLVFRGQDRISLKL
ncbi:MAG: histidinol-phosphatase, partial [Deltaproteobacteria bacterium]|jgi:histidinol-phosphatase (PHP family)|nr:histidinol-phosphatase [Deltaproteobacteria bacterium]